MREDMCVYSLLPISNPSGIIFFGLLFLISKNAGEHTPVTIVRKDFHLDELLRGNGDSLRLRRHVLTIDIALCLRVCRYRRIMSNQLV